VPEAGATEPLVAHRLTAATGDELRPHFSPDGKRLVFTGQYDGNVDVYVMDADGGVPRRLTFHPEPDVALAWSPDGKDVYFRSAAAQPDGRPELWRVPVAGGTPARLPLGECSLLSVHPGGRRIAFTPWSNESWSWKRYRGGTAPDVWVGDLGTNEFRRITTEDSNDLFPMWVGERVVFLSDRTGTANLWWTSPEGGEAKALTRHEPKADDPTAVEGYDVRWPSADAGGAPRIVFVQGGRLATLDVETSRTRRLDVRIASDRAASRERFEPAARTATGYGLSRDGKRIVLESRGDALAIDVEAGLAVRQVARDAKGREWGVRPLGRDRVVFVSDAGGEPVLAVAPADGSKPPEVLTDAGEGWIFAPETTADGAWIAFGDKALHLHVVEVATKKVRTIDTSEAWEIRDYRFSPDGRWLAYVKPLANGNGSVWIAEVATGALHPVGTPLHDDREPRWDPAGKYLYLLSRQHLDPVLSQVDFEHAFLGTTVVVAVPLAAATPPPSPPVARAAGFDLEAWADGKDGGKDGGKDKDDAKGDDKPGKGDDEKADEGDDDEPVLLAALRVDPDALPDRRTVLPIEPGEYGGLEAVRGGVLYLASEPRGLLGEDEDEGGGALDEGKATLHRRDLAEEDEEDADTVLAEDVKGFALSGDARTVLVPSKKGLRVVEAKAGGKDDGETVDVADVRLRVDPRREWAHIFEEAWRLQRDFYWAPTYCGCDWDAMRAKYAALLPRVGTRAELNDLVGQMIGELGTSHTYVYGGEPFARPREVSVGLLGADLAVEGDRVVVRKVLRPPSWSEDVESPLAAPHLGVKDGTVLLAVDGVPVGANRDVHEALQDRAGKAVRLEVADDAAGKNRRTITVVAARSERSLRYAVWVEANRRYVEEKSGGALGYLHIPDMGGEGLVAFSRLFYPQYTKRGLVVDIRGNGGGFVSQMIIRRLDRKPWAFMQPRHGMAFRYPEKSLFGPMAVLIDQHAGSDGDIFPASFRILGLGPLVGTRTWGGVVGIRSDKPFVDMGMSTQPEFAWWSEQHGWSVENRGVAPDVEVPLTPADRALNRDPQLDRAIEMLLEKLRKEPKELPKHPAYPTGLGVGTPPR
jgi:tricorn protease